MRKICKIFGGDSWKSLDHKIIVNKAVFISGCGDIHPYKNGPIFKDTETVFINRCNKNFTYYWLDKYTFPNINTIYLACHPCDDSVLNRFPKAKFYLSDRFISYKLRGAKDLNSVIIMTDTNIETELENFIEIPLISYSNK